MRWVNHYSHPGDNRYRVFVFRDHRYVGRFEERCRAADVPFERHEENGEVMFGVSKSMDAEAMNINHLVHAEFRDPFIPHRGWRWGLLVFTGSILALALWGWLTSTSAHGQTQGLPWELDVVGRMHLPVKAMGMEPTLVQGQGLTATWDPGFGTELGLRIHRRLRDGWTLGGGLEWVRREHRIVVQFENDSLGLSTVDTLPQMRSLSYRLPFLSGIRIPLGWKDIELQASGGVAVEWKISETIVSEFNQAAGADHVVQAYQGRTRYVVVPVLAEIGIQRRAKKEKPGWYVGWYWSSPMGRGAWAENTWTSGSNSDFARNWLSQVVTGLDLRLVLPE